MGDGAAEQELIYGYGDPVDNLYFLNRWAYYMITYDLLSPICNNSNVINNMSTIFYFSKQSVLFHNGTDPMAMAVAHQLQHGPSPTPIAYGLSPWNSMASWPTALAHGWQGPSRPVCRVWPWSIA